MPSTMSRKKPEIQRTEQPGPPKGTGRQNFKYVGLPVEVYEAIKAFADADDRTIPGVVKRACREYLERHKPTEDDPA